MILISLMFVTPSGEGAQVDVNTSSESGQSEKKGDCDCKKNSCWFLLAI